ncbi:neuropeptide SIFamide [Anoplophora glabripennis]|uniref:neuropeptide SIFamide n=1 Tax=Anoplophora glabripennis TaxID=217634 RepID=UPI00087356F4|nr:neuropeptide SIFamide [Anoplophora glabripennis]XP_018576889.1 neuropeptide SIFamide [Anoplophora glabripennis]
MSGYFGKTVTIFCVAVAFICAIMTVTEATYRKPPFNGSIFGKRTGSNTEYDSASKALSAMCEIANEACQSWFPITQEK